MLRFEWNALRRGDEVLVHDQRDRDLTLRPGVVAMLDTRRGTNAIGIRVGGGAVDGAAESTVLWPSYLAVHRPPLDPAEPCWRCDAVAAQLLALSVPVAV
jgi:hypothetical protein